MNECVNDIKVIGEIMDGLSLGYDKNGMKLYDSFVIVPRLSGNSDILPISIPENLYEQAKKASERFVRITGKMRTYMLHNREKPRMIVSIMCEGIEEANDETLNEVRLSGIIRQAPRFRKTPLGKEICETLLTVNGDNGKVNVIPCIAWDYVARRLAILDQGQEISLIGRFQSRKYYKIMDNGEEVARTAYEVSMFRMGTEG